MYSDIEILADAIVRIYEYPSCFNGGPWHCEIADLNPHSMSSFDETRATDWMWRPEYEEIDQADADRLILLWNSVTEMERIEAGLLAGRIRAGVARG